RCHSENLTMGPLRLRAARGEASRNATQAAAGRGAPVPTKPRHRRKALRCQTKPLRCPNSSAARTAVLGAGQPVPITAAAATQPFRSRRLGGLAVPCLLGKRRQTAERLNEAAHTPSCARRIRSRASCCVPVRHTGVMRGSAVALRRESDKPPASTLCEEEDSNL